MNGTGREVSRETERCRGEGEAVEWAPTVVPRVRTDHEVDDVMREVIRDGNANERPTGEELSERSEREGAVGGTRRQRERKRYGGVLPVSFQNAGIL
eukprot:s425_g16.t1